MSVAIIGPIKWNRPSVTIWLVFQYPVTNVLVNQLRGRPVYCIYNMPFLSTVLWYNKPNKSKNHTSILFIIWLCRNWTVFWDFYIHNSIRITEDLDNGDSDNWGSTVLYKHLLGSGFTIWPQEVIQKEHIDNPVYNKEAEVDHRCQTTLNVMYLAMTENVKPSEPCCLKIAGS